MLRRAALLVPLLACGTKEQSVPKIVSAPLDAQLVAACARVTSCPAVSSYDSVSRCLYVNGGPGRSVYSDRFIATQNPLFGDARYASFACLASAMADCSAINLCVHGRSGPCNVEGSTCVGNTVVSCSGGHHYEIDCSIRKCSSDNGCDHDQPPGSQCLSVDAGVAACGFGTCDPASFGRRCEGNTLVQCIGGVVDRDDCGCITEDGGASCEYGLGPCGDDVPAHCEGDDVVSCSYHHQYRVSCGAYPLPLVCRGHDCVPSPELRCDPTTHSDTCVGTNLVYCDGDERTLDCRALGFAGCEAGHCR